MKTRSAKAKGRRLQNFVVERLLEHFSKQLEEGDIMPAIMGESGEDIKRSPLAKKVFPYSIECKNQEKLNIWSALKQSQENCPDDDAPMMVFTRNRSDIYVALKFEDFLKLIKKNN